MIYVAELMDIKKDVGNGFPMCLLNFGEMEINCLLGRYADLGQKIEDFPIGGKYQFDIWISAANEFEHALQDVKVMHLSENSYLFNYLTGVMIEMCGYDEDGIPEVRIEIKNGLVFDVTGIQGPVVLQDVKPGDYVEISHGYFFIKDIYPLDYEEAGK